MGGLRVRISLNLDQDYQRDMCKSHEFFRCVEGLDALKQVIVVCLLVGATVSVPEPKITITVIMVRVIFVVGEC